MYKRFVLPLLQAEKRIEEYRRNEQWRQLRDISLICIAGLLIMSILNLLRRDYVMLASTLGSAVVLSYCLHITDIEPMKYGLFFERFLNPERVSMPDIDMDFGDTRRGEVVDYVRRKYGDDHVAQIVTFGTMAARGAIRDVGRALNMTYADCDVIAKLVPGGPGNLHITLDDALKLSRELREKYENDEQVKKLIDTARALEGMPRHASTHAAAIAILSLAKELLIAREVVLGDLHAQMKERIVAVSRRVIVHNVEISLTVVVIHLIIPPHGIGATHKTSIENGKFPVLAVIDLSCSRQDQSQPQGPFGIRTPRFPVAFGTPA